MRVKMFIVFVLLVVSLAILQLSCATTGGYLIGQMHDESKPDSLYLPAWKAEAVKPGTEINLHLIDDNRITGRYRGLGQVENKEYAERYSEFLKQKHDVPLLPALGDTITLTMESGSQRELEFIGFDYQHLAEVMDRKSISDLEAPKLAMMVKQLESKTYDMVFIKNDVRINYGTGNSTEGEVLRRLAFENKIPLYTTILVKKSDQTLQFPIDKVNKIALKNKKKYARWIGLGFGAVIDASIIVAIIALEVKSAFSD